MVERRIKQARFPAVKSLDSFDFLARPSLNQPLVLERPAVSTSTAERTSSPWATAALGRPMWPWGWGWPPASRD